MSWFETHLKCGAKDEALVRIDDQRVTVTIGKARPASRAYAMPEQAWCVYEANVEALLADGFRETANRCADQAPGALDICTPIEMDDLYGVRWRDGIVEAAVIDAADPVALQDGTHPKLRRAHALARFDKSKLDPLWEVDHVLRRLLHHPRATAMTTFELYVWYCYVRVIDRVRSSPRAHLLTTVRVIGGPH
jgi:hypothetical protein